MNEQPDPLFPLFAVAPLEGRLHKLRTTRRLEWSKAAFRAASCPDPRLVGFMKEGVWLASLAEQEAAS